jgi:molybdopterin-guanine dinucleotide biosynthesis protein A
MAGGKSSRMKRDKALLPFGGYNSLAEYQSEKYKALFSKVYISAKNNKFDFEVEIIEDCYEEASPLVALVSIFEALKADEVFILSVDSPLITKEIIEKIYNEAKQESDVVIAHSSSGLEPLCGIYRQNILKSAKAFLTQNRHRLQSLLEEVETQKVFFQATENFINLNHPIDYEDAIKSSFNI